MELSGLLEKGKREVDLSTNDHLMAFVLRKARGDLEFLEKKDFFQCEQYCFRIVNPRSIRIYMSNDFREAVDTFAKSNSSSVIRDKDKLLITIPKDDPGTLYLGDGIKPFEHMPKKENELKAYIGEQMTGEPLIADFANVDAAHGILAGTTGSGKSTTLNTMILSMAARYSPAELELYICDHKNLLNNLFDKLPQVKKTAGTDGKEFMTVCKRILEEMEARKQLLEDAEHANIEEYREETGRSLPYVLLIIDEADEMFKMAPAAVEMITSMVKEGRSIGIHVLLASQRPIHRAIDQTIFSMISMRIVLKQLKVEDSKRLLENKLGATLAGHGDLIYTEDVGQNMIRAQGAYVSTKDVKKAVKAIKNEI